MGAMDADVVVVGGGPAGTAAAITAARAGRDVVLVDKARFPRDKCCGDGLTTSALHELEHLGLDPADVASWTVVDEVWLRSVSGRRVAFPLPAGRGQFAAVARRADLDNQLLELARRAGVKVLDGHAMVDIRQRADAVEVDVEDIGVVRSPHGVAADGMWSPTRKALGLGPAGYLGEWHAFRQYFTNVDRAATEMWVWFEADLLPGYAWSFPLGDGRANVGFGIQRAGGSSVQSMKQQWLDILERPHIREVLGDAAVPEERHKAWPIPAQVGQVPLASGRVLFAGDAAATTDPMTGEGIGQALITGRLAAEAILSGGSSRSSDASGASVALPASVAARYTRSVLDELAWDHKVARLFSRGISHRKGVRIAIRAFGSTAVTRRAFARWMFEDIDRAGALRLRAWPKIVRRPVGAYR